MLTKAYIPYGAYYSTPFCRWQGAMANENAIVLGATTAHRWMAECEREARESRPEWSKLVWGCSVV